MTYLDSVHAIEEIVHLVEQVAATLIAAGLIAFSKKTHCVTPIGYMKTKGPTRLRGAELMW
jgi:hypothetical protein